MTSLWNIAGIVLGKRRSGNQSFADLSLHFVRHRIELYVPIDDGDRGGVIPDHDAVEGVFWTRREDQTLLLSAQTLVLDVHEGAVVIPVFVESFFYLTYITPGSVPLASWDDVGAEVLDAALRGVEIFRARDPRNDDEATMLSHFYSRARMVGRTVG